MKQIKFRRTLSIQILNGEKTATWRLFDDKDISENDEVELLVWEDKSVFANALITKVYEKTLGSLTDADWEGHEKFKSDKEMYKTYKKYYNQSVNKDTIVKIIHFQLK